MSENKKTAGKRALSRAKLMGTEEFSAKHTRKVQQLTERFFVLKKQLSRDAVETIREMGELLHAGAELLPRGLFGKWLDDTLGIGRTAARNYRRVWELSRSTPAVFLSGKHLTGKQRAGPSRIQLLQFAPRVASHLDRDH